jgi:site-specific DNA-cytosine methylase
MFEEYMSTCGCEPIELKQIQGFPVDYQATGSVKEQIAQIGNAVPQPLIRAVAQSLPE